jgi:hypothetical protein
VCGYPVHFPESPVFRLSHSFSLEIFRSDGSRVRRHSFSPSN